MLSLIFLGLCLASDLAGACILVLTRIEMREPIKKGWAEWSSVYIKAF